MQKYKCDFVLKYFGNPNNDSSKKILKNDNLKN